jgi:hypothetical protein
MPIEETKKQYRVNTERWSNMRIRWLEENVK